MFSFVYCMVALWYFVFRSVYGRKYVVYVLTRSYLEKQFALTMIIQTNGLIGDANAPHMAIPRELPTLDENSHWAIVIGTTEPTTKQKIMWESKKSRMSTYVPLDGSIKISFFCEGNALVPINWGEKVLKY